MEDPPGRGLRKPPDGQCWLEPVTPACRFRLSRSQSFARVRPRRGRLSLSRRAEVRDAVCVDPRGCPALRLPIRPKLPFGFEQAGRRSSARPSSWATSAHVALGSADDLDRRLARVRALKSALQVAASSDPSMSERSRECNRTPILAIRTTADRTSAGPLFVLGGIPPC